MMCQNEDDEMMFQQDARLKDDERGHPRVAVSMTRKSPTEKTFSGRRKKKNGRRPREKERKKGREDGGPLSRVSPSSFCLSLSSVNN